MLEESLNLLLLGQNPDGGWGAVAGKRSNTEATALALLALARNSHREMEPQLLNALYNHTESLSDSQMLEFLRDSEVIFARMGKPAAALAQKVIDRLTPLYPAKSEPLNRELSQLLIYLEALHLCTSGV